MKKIRPAETIVVIDGTLLLKTVLYKKNILIHEVVETYFDLLQKQFQKIVSSYLKIVDIYLVWDGIDSGIMRKNIYPSYKGNRNPKYYNNESLFELSKQCINKLLKLEGILIYEDVYAEADDCIAAIIKHVNSEKKVIISTDSDFYQLINKDVYYCHLFQSKLINDVVFYENNHYLCQNTLWHKVVFGDITDNIIPSIIHHKKNLLKENFPLLIKNKIDDNLLIEYGEFLNKEQFNINKILVDLSNPIVTETTVKNILNLKNDIKKPKNVLNLKLKKYII